MSSTFHALIKTCVYQNVRVVDIDRIQALQRVIERDRDGDKERDKQILRQRQRERERAREREQKKEKKGRVPALVLSACPRPTLRQCLVEIGRALLSNACRRAQCRWRRASKVRSYTRACESTLTCISFEASCVDLCYHFLSHRYCTCKHKFRRVRPIELTKLTSVRTMSSPNIPKPTP